MKLCTYFEMPSFQTPPCSPAAKPFRLFQYVLQTMPPVPAPHSHAKDHNGPMHFPVTFLSRSLKHLANIISLVTITLGLHSYSLPWGLLSAFILPDLLFYYHLEANVSFGHVDRETKVLKVCRHSYIFCL